MKNLALFIIVIISAAFIAIGCSKGLSKAEAVLETDVKSFENEFFTIAIADGFSEMKINGGVQVYKGNKFIEVHFRGYNQVQKDAEAGINILAKNYEGSVPHIVEMLGLNFYHSAIVIQGTSRDVYLAVKNGRMISITLSGQGNSPDNDLKAMFDSINLKA